MVGDDDESVAEPEPEKEICMTNPDVDRTITPEELDAHDDEKEPWFVINGQVYDGTPFLGDHPGGAASIVGVAGQDASEEFLAIRKSSLSADKAVRELTRISRQRKCEVDDAKVPHRQAFIGPDRERGACRSRTRGLPSIEVVEQSNT